MVKISKYKGTWFIFINGELETRGTLDECLEWLLVNFGGLNNA